VGWGTRPIKKWDWARSMANQGLQPFKNHEGFNEKRGKLDLVMQGGGGGEIDRVGENGNFLEDSRGKMKS